MAPGDTAVTTTVAETLAPQDPVVEFIALVEAAIADTRYAGQALAEPDVFVATGRLLCDSLTSGHGPETVVRDYVEALEGVPVAAASDDSLVLAGGLLGAAVATLCPEHAPLVQDG
jgi:hypothetical protein